MPLALIRETRELWDPWDADADEPYGTEDVFVVRDGDDRYEFETATAAHEALDFIDAARREGRMVGPCSWTIELTGSRRPLEVDFPSDLYGPCNAPAADNANGWSCLAGHEHRSDTEYYTDDEVASLRHGGHMLAENARYMDGREVL